MAPLEVQPEVWDWVYVLCWLGLLLQVPADLYFCCYLFSFLVSELFLFPPKFSFTEKLFTSTSLAIVFVQLYTRIFLVHGWSPSKSLSDFTLRTVQVKLSCWGLFSPDNKNVWSQACKLEAVAPAGLKSLESGCRWADGRWAVSQGWWLVYLQEEFSGHTVGTAAPSRLIHGTGMAAVLEKSASPGQR